MKKLIVLLISLLIVGCSNNKDLDLDKISTKLDSLNNNEILMFENNEYYDSTKLLKKYGFDTSNMEEFVVSMPTLIDKANMYMIIKPKNGKKTEVLKEIETFFEGLDSTWETGNYFPSEIAKVKNRLEDNYGEYLIYIISDDNDKVFNTIKSE